MIVAGWALGAIVWIGSFAFAPPTFAEPPNQYDRVKQYIAANDLESLRKEVELALTLESDVAHWSVYKGSNKLAKEAKSSAEEEIWRKRSFDASAHLGRPKSRAFALLYYRQFLVSRGRALEARRAALELIEVLPPDHHYVWRLAMPLADRASYDGRFDEALDLLAIAEGAAGSNPAHLARVVGGRGQIALDHGRVEVAADAFLREQELAAQGTAPDREEALRASFIHRANLRLATGQMSRLDGLVEQALTHPGLSERDPTFPAAMRLRRAASVMTREQMGIDAPVSAHELFQSVLDDPAATVEYKTSSRLRLAHMACNAGSFDEASENLAALPRRLTSADEVYRTILQARIERAQSGSRATVEEQFKSVWALLRQEWSTRKHSDGSGFLHDERVRLFFADWVEHRLALTGSPKEALPLLMNARAASQLNRALSARPVTVESVQSKIVPEGGGVALFWPAVDRSHLFLIDAKSVHHFELPPRDKIEQLRLEVAEMMRTPAPRGGRNKATFELLQARLRTLGQALFPPDAETLVQEWSSLTTVGNDLLRTVPFPALVLSNGAALGDRCAIGSLPSLAVGKALRDRRRPLSEEDGPPTLLVLAAPTLSDEVISSFPKTAPFELPPAQASLLVSEFPKHECLIGPTATWSAFSSAAGEATIAQLIVHGVRDPRAAGKPGLLLADDRAIGAHELANLRGPDLVVVTACGSGLGPMRLGDAGASDLSGPVLTAGADAVILPPGDLSYHATLALSQELHRFLSRGASPAEALRLARNELIRGGIWTDPTHHSQLLVIGLAHDPVVLASRNWTLAIGLGVVLLGAVVVGLRFGRSRRRSTQNKRLPPTS